MEKFEKDAINSQLDYICKNTHSVEQITVKLITVSLLTETKAQEILSPRTEYLRNYELYIYIMKKKGAMQNLLRILRDTSNEDIAGLLKTQLEVKRRLEGIQLDAVDANNLVNHTQIVTGSNIVVVGRDYNISNPK